ncbi:hypothetical protein BUALT_Bualt19G0094300 [Buddleja alternifolia]|uniref:Cytochrome b5 heme-binding domain-containing protein n=1 Tax=Buddleja alternifolia TaxID=168488 RepID=A0AAV6WAW9_9LAMI|nr:hypothetical protein BUALT_Bualt19G0094300 [Buddleja alternifolia]
MSTLQKKISISEIKKHNSGDSAWIIVHDQVYDCTHYLKDHPDGADNILINVGSDCTEEFKSIHSNKAKKMLEYYKIGELITTGYESSPNNSVHGVPSSNLYPIKEAAVVVRSVALVPREKIPCKLVTKTSLSNDVRLFRFALPNEEQTLGLQAIMRDPEDHTEMYVVYANRMENDILMKDELDRWAAENYDIVKVCYVVQETVKEEW